MEMTRRTFLRKIFHAALAFSAGAYLIAKKAPKKFICALKTSKYPGKIISCLNITRTNKWSG
jgi:hypothetical protein